MLLQNIGKRRAKRWRMSKMSLSELLAWAQTYNMSDEERFQQRISFAYGNTKMSNEYVTREMVERVAKEVDRTITIK